MTLMISKYLEEIRKHGVDWWWWKDRLATRTCGKLSRCPAGQSIFSEPWDNLIILDDCRYDIFAEEYRPVRGEKVERRISLGENTRTFLERNFNGEDTGDIIYVSANPFAEHLLKGKVSHMVSLWDSGWDDSFNTVDPTAVYAAALQASVREKGGRLVVHFLQPHHPYPNGTGVTGFHDALEAYAGGEGTSITCDIGQGLVLPWPYFGFKRIPFDLMEQGYRENLRRVLPHARRLADYLPGRTVITSDHGEACGERISSLLPMRVYGHPPAIRLESTVTVPWVVIETDDKQPERSLEEELGRLERAATRRAAERMRIRHRLQGLENPGGK